MCNEDKGDIPQFQQAKSLNVALDEKSLRLLL
jgi:hypothetical protein